MWFNVYSVRHNINRKLNREKWISKNIMTKNEQEKARKIFSFNRKFTSDFNPKYTYVMYISKCLHIFDETVAYRNKIYERLREFSSPLISFYSIHNN